MNIRQHHTLAVLIFVAVLLAGLLGGFALHQQISQRSKATQLDELSQQLMRRAEKAVDFVIIANSELLLSSQVMCDFQTRSKLREVVLEIGTVSDIYMITDAEQCSSFGDLSSPLPAIDERGQWVQARNPAYRFGHLRGGRSSFIGVSWGLGTDLELVAAISADALLFDILPNELRNTGRVDLSIADETVASFIGSQVREGVELSSFSTSGARYPFTVAILVDPQAFTDWRSDLPASIGLSWLGVCSFFAALAAWAFLRGRDDMLEDVMRALKTGEIVPHFQPIISVRTGSAIGCEALARWIKPDGTTVSPGQFIPVVERNALNGQLLALMIKQAASGLRDRLKAEPEFYVSFNVVPEQLVDNSFADEMMDLVSKHGLAPAQVCLEITERQVISSPERVAHTTSRLAKKGFRIAIDDAGTGHNGLAALQILAASTIKIDKFFVDHIDRNPRSRVLIDLFVSVARQYGMTTIAEGVETETQFGVLETAGVDAIQGFLVSRAVPASEFGACVDLPGLLEGARTVRMRHVKQPESAHSSRGASISG